MKLHIREKGVKRNVEVLTGKESHLSDRNPPLQTNLHFDNLHISPETYEDAIELREWAIAYCENAAWHLPKRES
jgi:hypothetical protein